MADRSRRIVIFGTSANPPTFLQGHTGIVRYLARNFDEVWVLPVYKHIFSSKSHLLSFEHRVNMCKLSFDAEELGSTSWLQRILEGIFPSLAGMCSGVENLQDADGKPGLGTGKVRVLCTERDVNLHAMQAANGEPVRTGSNDILKHLRASHRDVEFHWAMGADTYRDLRAGKWKDGEEFQRSVKILVIPRTDSEVQDVGEGAELHTIPTLGGVSSTQVRSTTDMEYLATALHPAVLTYIQMNRLYKFDVVVPVSKEHN
ncbi:hypothetical protein CYMTET_2709 [Cymbomonas tetramitiformis]|uniref:Cytidyltransferase-like domain-containing protein n=1 Tax=Cymbomonas tetramitiformis TaxID=36881 RepID=A0AAE0H4Q4_9CHLO|nr:hypothetical protein CYMTET_2709 [Cymbomonas tetramitiformis]